MARRHVVPSGNGWVVREPGVTTPTSRHRTQGAGEREARRQVRQEGGGEVVTHRPNGQIRDSDSVPPGSDPFPPRDRK